MLRNLFAPAVGIGAFGFMCNPVLAEGSKTQNRAVAPDSLKVSTKRWYFYKGKLPQESAQSMRLFKCADTPLADEIAQYLGVDMSRMDVMNFADGETGIKVVDNVRGQRVYIICSTTSTDRIMELLLAVSAMRRASAKKIVTIIPFYGYGRQDRVSRTREPIAAADIARMLEVMGVDQVLTVDLHSPQIEGFFKPRIPVDNLQAFPVGSLYFSEKNDLKNPVVIAPHSSAVYNAVKFRETMARFYDGDISMAMLIKSHKASSSEPAELIGDVQGRDCILVDTLVDTGSTLLKAAKLLKEQGARKVYAFCVHGRFSDGGMKRLSDSDDLDLLVVTNTIHHPDEEAKKVKKEGKILTLTIAPFVAEAISCLHSKGSLTKICTIKMW